MVRKRSKSASLICITDVGIFRVVMSTVVFVLLGAVMTYPLPHAGNLVDLPGAYHWVSMPRANRENALIITITRDGKEFLRGYPVPLNKLSANIRIRWINGAERKVYLNVDGRATYRDVVLVLNEVRSAGVENIAFMVLGGTPSQRLGK